MNAAEWAIDSWSRGGMLGSKPVKELKYLDRTDPNDYGIDVAHLFRLENGKYGVVVEQGCSCYSSDEAEVSVFETLKEANAFWKERVLGE